MKPLIFVILLLVASDRAFADDRDRCYEPHNRCPRSTKGNGQQLWLQRRGTSSCYNITTPGCPGHGFSKLWDCHNWCISDD
uniref:Pancreatic trypsin inhibitor n=1 Tax=Rhipicephalus zambeziensis TaxID=60191 RepID=A0A224YBF7_9ACAR